MAYEGRFRCSRGSKDPYPVLVPGELKVSSGVEIREGYLPQVIASRLSYILSWALVKETGFGNMIMIKMIR